MSVLGTIKKQPGEALPFSVNYDEVLDGAVASAIVSSATSSPAGLTLDSIVVTGTTAYGRVAGGTDGADYTVTVVTTLTVGMVDTIVEDEVKVKVREIL